MDSMLAQAPRARLIDLPARGGAMAALDFGDAARPVGACTQRNVPAWPKWPATSPGIDSPNHRP